jgi:PAS domain S-box-containing protein
MDFETFASLWDRILDPVLVADERLIIRRANPGLRELLRLEGPVDGKSIEVLLPELSRKRHAALAKGFIHSGDAQKKLSHPRIIRARRPDGSELPLEVSISAAEVQGERLFVLIFRDLTQQLQLQKEVTQLTQRLGRIERMEAMTTLSAGLAHDFNNMLTVVVALNESARRALPDGHSSRDDLDEAIAAAHRASDVVRRLLTFSRRTGQTTAAPLAPGRVLREVVQSASAMCLPDTTVTFDADPALPEVCVTDSDLAQAVLNLLVNGIHAMRARGGTLRVVARRLETEVTVPCAMRTLPPGHYLTISVEDTGPGIDPAVLPRIFDPFFTTKPEGMGTGLGLAMVYGFTRDVGGAVAVESSPGKGARFTLFLPQAPAKAGQAKLPAPRPRLRPSGRANVLLVNDDLFVCAAIKRGLELLGHSCHVVAHSADALAVVALDPAAFDLVVADENLAGLSGLELAEQLSGIEPLLPVAVMVSEEPAPGARPYRTLPKPVSATDIEAVMPLKLDDHHA